MYILYLLNGMQSRSGTQTLTHKTHFGTSRQLNDLGSMLEHRTFLFLALLRAIRARSRGLS